jgi:predicted transcriptional regulator
MDLFSTREAARKLGITQASLSRYIMARKVPAPKSVTSGRMTLHLWTVGEIENVRKLLPKIANGRKTRYKKKQSATGSQQLAKPKKPKKK